MAELGRVGIYRLERELGRGGVGVVYRATQSGGPDVALKILLAEGDPNATARFLREATLRIDHPNVVRTIGGGVTREGQPYVVQELLSGSTLREASLGMQPAEVVEAMRQAALGVGAIHDAGLVHRDLKPDNLFSCDDGTVKVLDLGIAAWVDGRAKLTATGTVIGTPAYLSPEQARGEPVDARADVWALGVVLYELLTGRSPFRRAGQLATMLAVTLDDPPTLRTLVPTLSPRVAQVVHRCLDRRLGERYATGGAVARALEEALHAAPDPAPTELAIPSASRRRAVALVLARSDAPAGLAELIGRHRGEVVRLRDGQIVGLFGASESRGDETRRALEAAKAALALVPVIAVGVGRAEVGAGVPTGVVVSEAEAALAGASAGVVCGPVTRPAIEVLARTCEVGPEVWEVSEASRPLARPELLGRHAELSTLRRARDGAALERRVVTTWITGPPGCGKTRLAEAIFGLGMEVGMEVFEARASALPSDMFAPWMRALDLRPSGSSGLDPSARMDQLREQIVSLLRDACDRGPTAVVLEDLQWADAASIELVRHVEEQLEGSGLWLVLTARSELLTRYEGIEAGAVHVEPSPLTAADVVQLAQQRGRTLDVRAAQDLVDHTGGNPMFLDLLVQQEIGTALPASIEHAIQSHLDAMPEGERDAFAALALVRWPATAAELEQLGVTAAATQIQALVRRGMVARAGGATFRPVSTLEASVAVELSKDAVRVERHRRAAELGSVAGRDDEHVGFHLEHAGDALAAARAYLRAMYAAAHGGDARKVVRCATAALGLSGEADVFDVHITLAEAAGWTFDPERRAQALERARELATTDPERTRVDGEEGDFLRRRGQSEQALTLLLRVAEGPGDPDVSARARCRAASVLAMGGQVTQALATLAPVQAAEATLAPPTLALLEDTRGFIAGSTGDHGERRRAFAEAARRYARLGDLRRSAGAEANAADASNRLGDFHEAERALRRCLVAARRVGNRLTEGYGLANLGYTLIALGRIEEALDALEQALRLADRSGDPHLRGAVLLYLARAAPERDTFAAQLTQLADSATSPTTTALSRALLAQRAMAAGDVAEALRQALEGLRVRDEAGGLEEGEAEVFATAARVLAAAGRHEEALEVASRGAERLHALAEKIQVPEAQRRFLEDVPVHRDLWSLIRQLRGG